MYRGTKLYAKGKKCYCPMCCQFGAPANGCFVEGKTKSGAVIALCSRCGSADKKKPHKDLPGQKLLDFGGQPGNMP